MSILLFLLPVSDDNQYLRKGQAIPKSSISLKIGYLGDAAKGPGEVSGYMFKVLLNISQQYSLRLTLACIQHLI